MFRIRTIHAGLCLCALMMLCQSAAVAQCRDSVSGPLTNFLEGIGNGYVNVVITWDHDNNPSTTPWFVVGGRFASVAGLSVNNVAAWDGRIWHQLANGLTKPGDVAEVRALVVYNNQLWAGGTFTSASGAQAISIARWNGTSWSGIGPGGDPGPSYNTPVNAMAVYNNKLVFAGPFAFIGAPTVRSWEPCCGFSALGNGINGHVYALATYNNQLYAGGGFTHIGGVEMQLLARYDGSAWNSTGITNSDLTNAVQALAVNPVTNRLIVGGRFNTVGAGIVSPNLAEYNSFTWFPVGWGQTTGRVVAITPTSGGFTHYYFAGSQTVGGVVTPTVGAFNTFGLSLIPATFNNPLKAIVFHDPTPGSGSIMEEKLIVAGEFTAGAGQVGTRIAQVQVSAGTRFALRHAAPIRALVNAGGWTVAAGDFTYPFGGASASHLVRWNGTTVSSVAAFPDPGQGTNGPVYSLHNVSGGAIFNSNLYVGGFFSIAGGVPATNIARYTYSPINAGASWHPMGAGFNNGVLTITSHNNQIYAGGLFTHSGFTPCSRVARWDAGTGSWQPVGTGLAGTVHALRSYNGQLYAGGSFGFTGSGASAPYIARWDGTNWISLGIGMNSPVYALTVDTTTNTLLIGGAFATANGTVARGIARWNGSAFSQVDSGLFPAVPSLEGVNAIAVHPDGRILAGGSFKLAADSFVRHSAEFNGTSWSGFDDGSDVDDRTHAVMYRAGSGEAYIAGELRLVGNGPTTVETTLWARLLDYRTPVFTQQPANQTVECGDPASFACQLAAGYAGYDFRWQRDGIDLVDGNGPGGSQISGANTSSLTINSTVAGNAGTYRCKLTHTGCAQPAYTNSVTLTSNCPNIPADLDGDGSVDVADLLVLLGAWGLCADPNNCPADLDDSGLVDVNDLLILLSQWG